MLEVNIYNLLSGTLCNFFRRIIPIVVQIVTISLLLLLFVSNSVFASNAMSFWHDQKKGTNFFNNHENVNRYEAAKDIGVSFVRLAPNKWLNGREKKSIGNFLIGSKKAPESMPIIKDVEYLKSVLDMAEQQNIKIILTMLSLPYSRWVQHSSEGEERTIWESFEAQDRAIEFWVNLVKEIKDHPAIVGINLRNEPSPEKSKNGFRDWYSGDYELWYQGVKNTPADLNLFYRKAVSAIRKVDAEIPIIIESGYYATPWAFKILEKIEDNNILYSFHMYEPYKFTSNQNKGNFSYNGNIPIGENSTADIFWDKEYLEEFLQPVIDFQNKYKIDSNRIIVSEFGGYRYNKGMELYLNDLIDIFNKNNWHWAFYSFREDDWDGMDYELGNKAPGWDYWKSIESGNIPEYQDINSSIFNVILKGLKD